MTFGSLQAVPPDPILGLMEAFSGDPAEGKIDLTVGVYRDDSGCTPLMRAVADAERGLLAAQATKAYLPPVGVAGFLDGVRSLVLGPLAETLESRTAAIQTPGGCGALRLAAELFGRAEPGRKVYLGEPTWGNHSALMTGAGLTIEEYPYYDPKAHRLRLDGMLERLRGAPERSLVVLQASCHNPSGADPDPAAWAEVLDVVEERALLPLFDLAYLGLGADIEADSLAVRCAAERLPEMLVAVSCSKNFGLYRERTGALLVLAAEPAHRAGLESNLEQIARSVYSMAPAHGALIVERVLGDAALRESWREELAAMAARLAHLRSEFANALSALRPELDTTWLARQRGMFSLLGLDAARVRALREERHIYMVDDSRINVAGLSPSNIPPLAEALAPLLG